MAIPIILWGIAVVAADGTVTASGAAMIGVASAAGYLSVDIVVNEGTKLSKTISNDLSSLLSDNGAKLMPIEDRLKAAGFTVNPYPNLAGKNKGTNPSKRIKQFSGFAGSLMNPGKNNETAKFRDAIDICHALATMYGVPTECTRKSLRDYVS